MPGPARKLVVVAADDGLLLQPMPGHQPTSPASSRPQQAAVKIHYKTHKIVPTPQTARPLRNQSVSSEAYGIVGLLSVAEACFLILITQREQVAQIRGHAVFVVKDVSLIPISRQDEASRALPQGRKDRNKPLDVASDPETERSSEPEELSDVADDVLDRDQVEIPAPPPEKKTPTPSPGTHRRRTSVAEDVIGKKGVYGRFAERWFSKKGWTVEKRRMQGMSTDDLAGVDVHDISERGASIEASAASAEADDAQPPQLDATLQPSERGVTHSLLPKLLRTTKMLFASQSFFFSYDYDITRSFASQKLRAADLPLHKSVDPLYFWNRHLILPFIKSRLDPLVLPLMQGFVGQRSFSVAKPVGTSQASIVDAHVGAGDGAEVESPAAPSLTKKSTIQETRNFLLTLISRRSIERAGLRYLRRGVDDEGHVANMVESEQILSDASWDETETQYSLVQVRGSIPLYFSQSPYSFKPVPVMEHSTERNDAALKRHLSNLARRYGELQLTSLVSKHGNEAKIGEEYEQGIQRINGDGGIDGANIGFEWFDFHDVCRGMKFENVSILMDTLGEKLDHFGSTVQRGDEIISKQGGVLRTNCMDCLDRTNVVQSACARRALEQHLTAEGISLDLQNDTTTQWFNTLWADNGDAISKQYSSTAALKGDYTRTRKRDYRGALNDLGLSLSRYFNNIVNDYFSQAAIDYLLGNATAMVFEEFEAEMRSGDPKVEMERVRQNAVDTAARLLIESPTEDLLGGWTLLSPPRPNTVRPTSPLETVVLLLTSDYLYTVRFTSSLTLEKIASFERIALEHVVSLSQGVYVTSTLGGASQTDEHRNRGFVVVYSPGEGSLVRVNTRSLGGKPPGGASPGETDVVETTSDASASTRQRLDTPPPPKTRLLAFKALPSRSAFAPTHHHDDDDDDDDAPHPPPDNSTTPLTEQALLTLICTAISHAVSATRASTVCSDKTTDPPPTDGPLQVETRNLISLAEARRATGLLEQLGWELKKFVWA